MISLLVSSNPGQDAETLRLAFPLISLIEKLPSFEVMTVLPPAVTEAALMPSPLSLRIRPLSEVEYILAATGLGLLSSLLQEIKAAELTNRNPKARTNFFVFILNRVVSFSLAMLWRDLGGIL